MDCPQVTLTAPELLTGCTIGGRRQCQNLWNGRQDRYGAPLDKGWQLHIQGALGEMVFAKWLDRYWSGCLGDLDAADVADYQVRAPGGDDRRLILHPSDKDHHVFVLVTGFGPTFTLRGWVWGREGKRPEYWEDPTGGRPAYFVPQDALHPMSELPELGDRKATLPTDQTASS